MKFQWSPYKLNPVAKLNSVASSRVREGILLKVSDDSGLVGYSDLHPWPELGDISIQEQLVRAQRGELSMQFQQSVKLALRDAQLRKKKMSIFDLGQPLRNNAMITTPANLNESSLEILQQEGFETLKIKLGEDYSSSLIALSLAAQAGFQLRLDFNGALEEKSFIKFLSQLREDVITQIEYVEDPFPYEQNAWQKANDIVPLAMDNFFGFVSWDHLEECPFSVLVVKPAKLCPEGALALCQKFQLNFTVTSYMDHPLGVLHAYAWALELSQAAPSMALAPGCLTLVQYEQDEFSKRITSSGPFLQANSGYGVGFDSLLESMSWQS